ncbi:MAG: TonB-dependent receptor [Myxococcota bacterium]
MPTSVGAQAFGAIGESDVTDTEGSDAQDEEADNFGAVGDAASIEDPEEDLAHSQVTRAQMDERLPRSAPDALRYEPGVAVQQTAHAQASPYVRGMTGQQVVHLFDGVRMNNGIYRQGPNQYFFTVDQRSIAQLDVLRGASSVRFGSDALGGAILATPLRPLLDPDNEGFSARPQASFRFGSQDQELGGRGQLELRLGADTAVLVGVGYRDVNRLESGGVVRHRQRRAEVTRGDVAPWVPRFEEEERHPDDPSRWRTQLGTGFREATYDARLEHAISPKLRLVAATYGYRQSDAPRTDQCPAPEAPLDECLFVDEQNRSLSYLALRGDAGPLRDVDLIVSHQRHNEARRRERPRSNVRFRWRDIVDTFGVTFRAASRPLALRRGTAGFRYGFEMIRDEVSTSRGSRTFTDIDNTRALSRGQYLAGSHFLQLGAWTEAVYTPVPWLTFRGGGRVSVIDAGAPPDPESGTSSVNETFHAVVGRVGAALRPGRGVTIQLNVDQGFRAPNLDDLTSRQQVGPGFQFENPNLEPERTWTSELGLRVRHDVVRFDLWGFATVINDGIQRVVREIDDCPPSTPDCRGSRDPFQLVNAEDRSMIFGTEGGVTLHLPQAVTLRSTLSYAWGEGPSLGDRGAGNDRVPLSRIPPLQGTFEGRYRHRPSGVWFGAALRWAAPQTRLAIADESDPRIPDGGSSGYAVFDLRLGWRYEDFLAIGLAFENVGDAAYRVHGSSINGPGRGVALWVRVGR